MGQKPVSSRQGELDIPSEPTYCCDASALIDLDRSGLLKKLKQAVKAGRVKVPEGVFRELRRKTDRLGSTLEKWKVEFNAVVKLGPGDLAQLPLIEQHYGPSFSIGHHKYRGFWAGPSGKKSADGQVVALAKARGWTAVSGDGSIRAACAIEGVDCVSWEDLARRLSILPTLWK